MAKPLLSRFVAPTPIMAPVMEMRSTDWNFQKFSEI